MVTTQERVVEEIAEISKEFYDAINAMFYGNIAPIEEVWSHSDDVTYLGPQGGLFVGWKEVSKQWRFQATLGLKGRINMEQSSLVVVGDIAIAQGVERGFNIIDGEEKQVKIRATNIFRRENDSWKVISHHTDRLSFIKEE